MQDAGRYGYQHWGINPGGYADNIAAAVANMLVGNSLVEAVIEMHYPAASILFEKDALIAISGADFGAVINNTALPLNEPVIICHGSTLVFTKPVKGYRCYLAVQGGWALEDWLGSYATNITAAAGGYKGRKLMADDAIAFNCTKNYSSLLNRKQFLGAGWKIVFPGLFPLKPVLRICKGNEYEQLTAASKNLLTHTGFAVSNDVDRMGCRLVGTPLQINMAESLVSAGVTGGTIQLLPAGQLIILSADHQTTGGYPRVAHVASADMHILAQLKTGDVINFEMIDIMEAEKLLLAQHQYLLQLQIACNLRLQEFFDTHAIH